MQCPGYDDGRYVDRQNDEYFVHVFYKKFLLHGREPHGL